MPRYHAGIAGVDLADPKADSRTVGIQVLGPLTIGGSAGHGLRDRVVLEVLVVRANETVDTEVLADAVWAQAPPVSWAKVLQGCISRLRRCLGPGAIETTSYGGYVLRVHDDQIDSHRFERLVARARDHLADDEPDRASYVLDEALSLWRGRAFADLDEWEPGRTEAERLDGVRMDAQELRIEAEIAAGRGRSRLEDARALVREAPFRERRWALFARGLYQSGRQGEALDVLGQAKRMLRDELGLDPGTELLALEEAILRQDPELEHAEFLTTQLACPYRGLLPYESEDAETFFGREADVEACLARLRTHGVLAVVGPSGTGKSSLVRAGVVAGLRGDGTDVLVTTPGSRPLDSLAALPSRAPFPVVVVDQAEEAVTLCSDPAERTAYLDILEAYEGPVVLALRADRLGELSTHPGFARLVERGLYLLSSMSEDNLRAAIGGPARQAGLRIQPGLADLLVREVQGEPGALPMLSHVLRQTWERREGPTLTVEGYRATGGIRDAVAQSAEDLYTRFDARQQEQVRALLLRLVAPGDDGIATRSRVPRATLALDPAHEQLIDALAAARLVSSDAGDVQIAHEALAREWPRLRGWLEEDVEGQRIFRHLAASAPAWDAMGRPVSELYRGVRLVGATEWADRHEGDLTGTERAFLDASRSDADRELRSKARANRRLRLTLGGVGVLLVVALGAGVVAADAAQRARAAGVVADSRRLSAQALTTVEPDLAVLLGLQAVRIDDSNESRSALNDVLEQTGQLVAVARGSGFEYLDVSPDGSSVAVTSASGADVQGQTTYDAQSLVETGRRADMRTLSLAYSPDGARLAVAVSGYDPVNSSINNPDPNPVRLLDAHSLAEVGTFGGFVDGAFVVRDGLDFSADGSRLVAVAWRAGHPFEAMVWDTDHPAEPVLRVRVPEIYARVQLSPDGKTLFVAQRSGEDRLRAIDVDTGTVLLADTPEFRAEREGIIALSPDGSTLARSDVDGIVVLDAGTFERRFTLAAESQGVSALAFGPDGTRLAAGYADGTIIVWDLPTRGQLRTLHGHAQEVTDVAFNPDGNTLYSVAPDKLLLAWDVAGSRGYPGWKSFTQQPVGFDLARAIPSPDGSTVLYQSYGRTLDHQTFEFRDLTTGDLTPIQDVGRVHQYVWSPDSRVLLSAGGSADDSSLWLQTWDPTTGDLSSRNDHTVVKWLTYTSDGSSIWGVSPDGRLWQVDPETLETYGAPIVLPPLVAEDWDVPMISPDGRTLVQRRWATSPVVVVDLATRAARDIDFDTYPFTYAFSPDSTALAVFYGGGSWGIVDVAALRRRAADLSASGATFTSNVAWEMTYSGTQIVTTGTEPSTSGTRRPWTTRAASTSAAATTSPPPSDDRRHTILVAHPQGQVLTWDTRSQHILDAACQLAGRNLSAAEWDSTARGDRTSRSARVEPRSTPARGTSWPV